MKNKSLKITAFFCSLITICLVWQLCCDAVNSSLILPSIKEVSVKIFEIVRNRYFWLSFSNTFLRIILSFVFSSVIGIIFGILASEFKFIKYYLEPFLVILRVTPVVALILIVTFWFKSGFVPIFVSILMTLPIMITSVNSGFSIVDANKNQMAETYGFSRLQKLYYIKLPAAFSSVKEGLISTFGLSWKVVVAGEVLCLPKSGIGSILQKANLHLESAEVFAITIILILFCFVLQKMVTYVFRSK